MNNLYKKVINNPPNINNASYMPLLVISSSDGYMMNVCYYHDQISRLTKYCKPNSICKLVYYNRTNNEIKNQTNTLKLKRSGFSLLDNFNYGHHDNLMVGVLGANSNGLHSDSSPNKVSAFLSGAGVKYKYYFKNSLLGYTSIKIKPPTFP